MMACAYLRRPAIDINFHLFIHNVSGDKKVEHALTHLTALVNEVLRAVVSDPKELAKITKHIEDQTARLREAIQQPDPPTDSPTQS